MVNTCTARRAETESHAMVLVRDVPSGSVPCQLSSQGNIPLLVHR